MEAGKKINIDSCERNERYERYEGKKEEENYVEKVGNDKFRWMVIYQNYVWQFEVKTKKNIFSEMIFKTGTFWSCFEVFTR